MKFLVSTLAALASLNVSAGGYTSVAVPTEINIVQAGTAGFMVYGDFGNPASCTIPNGFFVKATHPQYSHLYSTALAAFMSGKKLQAYVHACETVGWYAAPPTTHNVVSSEGGALSLKN